MTKKIAIVGGEGYIGSYLLRDLAKNYPDTNFYSYDLGWFSHKEKPILMPMRDRDIYFDGMCWSAQDLVDSNSISFLRKNIDGIENFEVIIWVAGHSSVTMCVLDPQSAWNNNVRAFREFLSLYMEVPYEKRPLLIIASSSSVYGRVGNDILATENMVLPSPESSYDETMYQREAEFRYLLTKAKKLNTIVLRLGTVCGAGINHRSELMINSMVQSALTTGRIYYSNPKTNRAILYNQDLANVVGTLIINNRKSPIKGYNVYNVGSINANVGLLAEDTKIILNGMNIDCKLEEYDSPESKYSFMLDCSKLINDVGEITFVSVPHHSIIHDLVELYTNPPKNTIIGDRNETRKYDLAY